MTRPATKAVAARHRHEAALAGLLGEMRATMDGMSHCARAGMSTMSSGLDDLDAALAAHRSAVDASGDLDLARAACDAYAADAGALIDDMMSAADRMCCMCGHR